MKIDGLAADRALLGRTSMAEQVAGILRDRIIAGDFQPGVQLAEQEITEALKISRNTLREAFRLLTHERLLIHELSKGVFVRKPDVADVVDLYRVRKHIECSVVRTVVIPPVTLGCIAAAVDQGQQALDQQDWQALGTANIRFHQEIVAVAGSPRIDELMRGVLAELRLVFHVMDNPRWFHQPYLSRNREILGTLEEGNGTDAATLLAAYLDDAEQQLVAAYTVRRAQHVS